MPESRYRIVERVATGGMAEVFKGVAESLQGFRKNVAIKRVLPNLTKNKKFVAMFLDEARLCLNLQHANIAQVFDIGHVDDTYFIVMEYVDGVDLKSVLEWRRRINKPLTIGQTIYIAMEMCKGLNYAHDLLHPETGESLNIVHRDVSPPNVLLSRNGEIKIVDFGLAKAAVQIEHTDPGVVKGKMSYLSPEAARGEDVDHRADIFAVGILLYEMLTNRRLFYGETDFQTVELVRAAKIPPIGPQNPEVEPDLEVIVRKALARRIDDRFQSATDLQDALAHYLFSRGLKMIQRDIADLTRNCIDDIMTLSGKARKQKVSVVDTMLQEEIRAFTSMDFNEDGQPQDPQAGARLTGEMVDPRAWADDADWPGRRTGGVPQVPGGLAGPATIPPVPDSRPHDSVSGLDSSPSRASQPLMPPALPGVAAPVAPASQSHAGPVSAPEPERRKLPKGLLLATVLVAALAVGAGVAALILRR